MLEVREVVDPIDQTTDLANAVSWVYGEPQCDRERIGLWGSSYSGGHVVYVAARDPRVKATVSQVPALDSRSSCSHAEAQREKTFCRSRGPHARRARLPAAGRPGDRQSARRTDSREADAVRPGRRRRPGPTAVRCCSCWPKRKSCSTTRTTASWPTSGPQGRKKLVVIPGITHYGVYLQARKQAQQLAIAWYDEHLKGGK